MSPQATSHHKPSRDLLSSVLLSTQTTLSLVAPWHKKGPFSLAGAAAAAQPSQPREELAQDITAWLKGSSQPPHILLLDPQLPEPSHVPPAADPRFLHGLIRLKGQIRLFGKHELEDNPGCGHCAGPPAPGREGLKGDELRAPGWVIPVPHQPGANLHMRVSLTLTIPHCLKKSVRSSRVTLSLSPCTYTELLSESSSGSMGGPRREFRASGWDTTLQSAFHHGAAASLPRSVFRR